MALKRNKNVSFSLAPTNNMIRRSKWDQPTTVKTSFNVGDVVPFYVQEVLPNDTHSIDFSAVARLQPMVSPMMDNLFLDRYWFFVPNRLVWDHWQQFCGENTESAWIPQTEYTIPQMTAPLGGWNNGTIADYMGIPTKVEGLSVNALPFRAYALIMNEWFRDENLTDPLNIQTNDATVAGSNGSSYINDVAKGGKPFIAAKYHDYFTSALPSPLKGEDVTINIAQGEFPVVGNGKTLGFYNHVDTGGLYALRNDGTVKMAHDQFNRPVGSPGVDSAGFTVQGWGVPSKAYIDSHGGDSSVTGLVTNLDNAVLTTVNQLRFALQVQAQLELEARGGSRYTEILRSAFGITSPDSRLQRPEYLGGDSQSINVTQVLQSSASAEGSTPQGNPVGQSLTTMHNHDMSYFSTEHGYIIGLMVARYPHTYQQGLEPLWTRKTKYDFYWPLLNNIGEQPIYNREIFATGLSTDDEVFGYQEAWSSYRYKPSHVTGEMRSNSATSLDSWHLADDYKSLPHLSDEWIREDKSALDRVLAVSSSVSNQLFADMRIVDHVVRPMGLHSIPGIGAHL